MTYQSQAEAALKYARQVATFKSSNKRNLSKSGAEERVQQATDRMKKATSYEVGDQLVQPDAFLPDPKHDAEQAEKYRVGNCYHLACLAVRHLRGAKVACAIVQLQPPGDHLFAVAGMAEDEVQKADKNVASWTKDAFICDPWANIACPVQEYPAKFEEKMKKWYTEGKEILYQNKWIRPNDHVWVQTISTCGKNVVYWDF